MHPDHLAAVNNWFRLQLRQRGFRCDFTDEMPATPNTIWHASVSLSKYELTGQNMLVISVLHSNDGGDGYLQSECQDDEFTEFGIHSFCQSFMDSLVEHASNLREQEIA